MSVQTTDAVIADGATQSRLPLVAALVIALTAAAAGAGRADSDQMTLGAERAADARRAVAAWLECGDCTDGELQAVATFGEAVVPSLAASLRDGPAPARRELLRRHLMRTYEQLKGRTKLTQEQYVERSTENYIAHYRVRAAEALGVIGGPHAKQALEDAVVEPYRDDVKRSIRAALARLQNR